MADLDDFQKSLKGKSEDELTEMLREIRLSRRKPAAPTNSTAGQAKKKRSKEPKMNVEGMSPEMAKKLLEQLGGTDE